MSYEGEKYNTSPEGIKATIEKYGVAVVPSVLDEEELKGMRDGMWDYLEHVTQNFDKPIGRDDSKSWVEYLKLYPKHSMLLQQYGVGRNQFVWDLRQNEKVVDIFSKIWEKPKEDLLVSFDGASFHFPQKKPTEVGTVILGITQIKVIFAHILNAYKVGLRHMMLMREMLRLLLWRVVTFTMKNLQRYLISRTRVIGISIQKKNKSSMKIKDCIKKIKCKAGSMVFWDSRTIHCGTEPVKKREEKKVEECSLYLYDTER